MSVERLDANRGSGYRHKVKVSHNPGVSSIGYGDTIDEAIGEAAWGLNIAWYSVESKMTEHEWSRMSHL